MDAEVVVEYKIVINIHFEIIVLLVNWEATSEFHHFQNEWTKHCTTQKRDILSCDFLVRKYF